MRRFGVSKSLLLCSIGCILAIALSTSGAHAQLTTYAFDGIEPLLDANFYAGVEQGGVPAGISREAFFASANPQATQVAFYIVQLVDAGPPEVITSALGIVDIGDTASWRIVPGTIDALAVNQTIAWSPNGQFVFTNLHRINIDTGAGVGEPFIFI